MCFILDEWLLVSSGEAVYLDKAVEFMWKGVLRVISTIHPSSTAKI